MTIGLKVRKALGKTLILFEFKDEIESFISQRPVNELRGENIYVLAIMPESQAYLQHLQIPFFNTYSFFGKEGHEQALLQSEKIYQFCEPFLNIEDDIGIKEGYKNSLLLYTRTYAHYILWLIEVIERACIRWNIKKLICCCRDNRHVLDPFPSVTEGYVSEIGARVAKKLNIDFESFQTKKIAQNLLLERLKKYLKEIAKYLIYQIKFHFLQFQVKSNKILLTTSRQYNLGRVLDEFKQTFSNAHIVYLNDKKRTYLQNFLCAIGLFHEILQLPVIVAPKKRKVFFKNLNDVVLKLTMSDDSGDAFTYKGITFKDLVMKKLWKDIIPILCETYSQTVHLNTFLKKYRPTLIISQMARGINYNLGEIASLYGIPSVLISHGSHVPPKNNYEMIEWKEHGLGLINTQYKYIAVQSPWAKLYIDKIPIRSEQIITGPLLFANTARVKNSKKLLRERLIPNHRDKIILLHADTPRQRADFRFYVYQTADEYIWSLNSLISAVEKIKDLYLIIRFRPKYYLSKETLESLLHDSPCYSVRTEGTFEEYLSIADMLISYSSTTIEESLQNNIPVLLYDSQGKYCHIPCQMLAPSLTPEIGSCYYINSEHNLPWALQWLVENHFSKDIQDTLWEKHVFSGKEKIDLTSYFNKLFSK